MSLLRTKSIEQSIKDTDDPDHKLRKDLGALDLIVFGVGVIIGAGIFVLTGTVAATQLGSRPGAELPHRRGRVRPGRPLLRGVRLDRPGRRERLHVQLRDDG